jgi:hypothetical protein
LIGVTSSGNLVIWDIPLKENVDNDEAEMDIPKRLPVLQRQVTSGCLYSIQFWETNHKIWMFLCGDDGVWGYDWKHWRQLLDGTNTTTIEPKVEIHCKPHPCPYKGMVEINDFTVFANGAYILGAAGDAFGGYKWDMETQKLLHNYPSAKKGKLNTITCIENGPVLMGGQDGIIGIWDCQADKLIDNIDLKKTMDKHPSSLVAETDNTGAPSDDDASTSRLLYSISHIDSSFQNWWTVCGGTTTSHKHDGGGGHVTSWHAPTRTLVAGCKTRETPQFVCCSSPTNLVTLADEGVVTHWSQLERKQRVWCSPPSSFAAAYRKDDDNYYNNYNNMLAVGGVGNLVDIFDNMTDKLYSLSLTDTV